MKVFDMAFCYMVFTLMGVIVLSFVLNVMIFVVLCARRVITRETISKHLLRQSDKKEKYVSQMF